MKKRVAFRKTILVSFLLPGNTPSLGYFNCVIQASSSFIVVTAFTSSKLGLCKVAMGTNPNRSPTFEIANFASSSAILIPLLENVLDHVVFHPIKKDLHLLQIGFQTLSLNLEFSEYLAHDQLRVLCTYSDLISNSFAISNLAIKTSYSASLFVALNPSHIA